MKITHYQRLDSNYINLAKRTAFETKEITKDFNIDLDVEGHLVGSEFHGNASKFVRLFSIVFKK